MTYRPRRSHVAHPAVRLAFAPSVARFAHRCRPAAHAESPVPLGGARTMSTHRLASYPVAGGRLCILMRAEGLEPPRAEAHQDLNLARMPIPPRPRGALARA